MKVLMINGSPRPNGNDAVALKEMEKVFTAEGIEVETVVVGNKDIRGCIGCLSCKKKGTCVFDDLVNETAPKFVCRSLPASPGMGCTAACRGRRSRTRKACSRCGRWPATWPS